MVKLSHLINALTFRDQPDTIKVMKVRNECRPEVQDVTEMNYMEKRKHDEYTMLRLKEIEKYSVWATELQRMCLYQSPHINWTTGMQKRSANELYITAEFV